MALNRSDKSRILRRYFPGMTRNSEMSTEPKPIPRWDVHFGILKTNDKSQRLVISPLVANRAGTGSAVKIDVHFTLALV